MFHANTKLKKTSDSIFEEAEPPKERSRPLEWRRNFNKLSLPLKNIEVVTHVNTHDKDWDLKGEFKDNPVKLIKPDIRTNVVITAVVDEDKMRDTIYCAEKDDDEDEIFTLERPRGKIQVFLKSGKPIKGSEKFPDGVFYGNCFRMKYTDKDYVVPNEGEDEDYLIFEMAIPEEQLNTLVSNLQLNLSPTVDLYVELLSFSYEVDDFLRQYYHPRDIFIHDDSNAFVFGVGLASKVGMHTVEKSDDEKNDSRHDDIDEPKEPSSEQRAHQELTQALLQLQTPLGSIFFAMCVLVFILTLLIFL